MKISISMPNITYIAVKRQLTAFGCEDFEVGIYDRSLASVPGSYPMCIRFWSGNQILKSLGFLKSQNAQGCDIFIRPSGSVGLIFFDDLDLAGIEAMKTLGLEPAIVIESSPQNYQGWIRVADKPLPEALATTACKVVAETLRGDVNSADWRHFGRLAGFTNRKPAYVNEIGQYPFVRIHETREEMCSRHETLLEEAARYLAFREAERIARAERLKSVRRNPDLEDAGEVYLRELKAMETRYGNVIDLSRADWAIVNKMANQGYSPDELRSVLMEHSPAVEKRAANPDSYLNATIGNIFSYPGCGLPNG